MHVKVDVMLRSLQNSRKLFKICIICPETLVVYEVLSQMIYQAVIVSKQFCKTYILCLS